MQSIPCAKNRITLARARFLPLIWGDSAYRFHAGHGAPRLLFDERRIALFLLLQRPVYRPALPFLIADYPAFRRWPCGQPPQQQALQRALAL